jgi:hypothetical protein
MAQTLLGIFDDREHAEMAIHDLEESGLNPKDVSVVMKDKEEAESLSDSTGSNVAQGAVSGATTGGVIGGLAGLLVGIGAIAVPGIGALLIGGPLAAALGLSGAAATTASGAMTGALAGGVVGALVGLGVPEEEAKVYEERIKSGGILIAVPTNEAMEGPAKDIFEKHGADEIKSIGTH